MLHLPMEAAATDKPHEIIWSMVNVANALRCSVGATVNGIYMSVQPGDAAREACVFFDRQKQRQPGRKSLALVSDNPVPGEI